MPSESGNDLIVYPFKNGVVLPQIVNPWPSIFIFPTSFYFLLKIINISRKNKGMILWPYFAWQDITKAVLKIICCGKNNLLFVIYKISLEGLGLFQVADRLL